MGAAEVLHLSLDDINWHTREICMYRPKNGFETMQALTDPVAEALADYLQHVRQNGSPYRNVFLSMRAPYKPISRYAVAARLTKYARIAGVSTKKLGTHSFRRSFAARGVSLGADPKVLSEIMGQRTPRSFSAYVRISPDRLRDMCLPVPV